MAIRVLNLNMQSANRSVEFEILLVDDSPADAKIFQESLTEASTRVRVYWVSGGEEALTFLHQRGRFSNVGAVKLVLLDLNMPGLDGIETLRQIKMDVLTRRIPVVVFSSSRAKDEVDLAYSLGANAYFSKPLSLENYVLKARVLVQHWLDYAELPSPLYLQSGSAFTQDSDAVEDQFA